MEEVLEHLKAWKDFVSVPRKFLDNFAICPFAKKTDIIFDIIKSEEYLLIDILKKEKSFVELFMFVDVNNILTYEKANCMIDFYNSISEDYQYFVDDYNNPQIMGSIDTSNGKYLIIIGQRIDILNIAREKLKKTVYYSFLEKEYLKKIGVKLDECKID